MLAACNGGSIGEARHTPMAADHAARTPEDTLLSGTLPAATGRKGDVLTYSLSGEPGRGTALVSPDGHFSYMPAPDFHGVDSFRYQVSDSKGNSNSYTVSLTVEPVNDAPRTTSNTAPAIFVPGHGVAVVPDHGGGNALAVDSSGRILVAGGSNKEGQSSCTVARYTDSGALDTDFGGGAGILTLPLGSGDAVAEAIAVDGSGRIVVAGRSIAAGQVVFTVVRYTATGAVDTDFAGTGIVTTPVGSAAATVSDLALDDAGRILVAGTSKASGRDVFTLARYTATGDLDATFGTGGIVTAPDFGGNALARSMVLDEAGRILVAGSAEVVEQTGALRHAFALARYTADGVPDATFGGGDGVVLTSFPRSINASITDMTLDENGRIVVAGHSAYPGAFWDDGLNLVVARYTSAGVLDTEFAQGKGFVETAVGTWTWAAGIALDDRSRIIAAGGSWDGAFNQLALVRYTSAGTLDSGFGPGHGIVTSILGGDSDARDLLLDGSGHILVAGHAGSGVLARFTEAGVLDATFNEVDPVGQPFRLRIPGRFFDVDGDALTYATAMADGAPLAADIDFDADSFTFSGTVPANAAGLTLKATDSAGLVASETYLFPVR